jgi:hypothetical protein
MIQTGGYSNRVAEGKRELERGDKGSFSSRLE